ncbi:MAG: hypothetical protein AAFR31_03045 [Cyanobacteria bacterium J06627_8]
MHQSTEWRSPCQSIGLTHFCERWRTKPVTTHKNEPDVRNPDEYSRDSVVDVISIAFEYADSAR